MAVTLEGNIDYLIFFDDQHIQRFVTSFNVNMSVNGAVGEASIEVIYADAFLDIEYMTDVKIFIKNVFNGRYRMVFDGQIHSRQISMSPSGRSITFFAYDYMYWLQKLPVPLFFGIGDQLMKNIQLSWLAKGVDVRAVSTVLAATDVSLTGKNMRDILESIFGYVDLALAYSANYSDPDKNNIDRWINIKSKIRVLSDFDPDLRDRSIISLFYKGNIMENAYVLLNSIAAGVGYELYQDIDSIIKIKEPFWHDGIIKPFILDKNIITGFGEHTNWDARCTRVLALGGVEEAMDQSVAAGSYARDMLVPGVVYVQGDIESYFVTGDDLYKNPSYGGVHDDYVRVDLPDTISDEEAAIRTSVINYAMGFKWGNIRYDLGGGHGDRTPEKDGTLDCSGYVYHCYRRAGMDIGNLTSYDFAKKYLRISADQLLPGDPVFNNPDSQGYGHIGMYVGKRVKADGTVQYVHTECNRIKLADGTVEFQGVRDLISSTMDGDGRWLAFGNFFYSRSQGYDGHSDIHIPTGTGFQEKVLPLTDTERKYGINLVETAQPLIRVGWLSSGGATREEAFDLLKDYTQYLHTTINGASSVASVTTLAAPWLRPGFNVWVDPGGISRVYYINSVSHQGSAGVVQTSLNLSYGRSEDEYKYLYGINKDKAANPFTKERRVTAKDYYNNGELDFITPDNMNAFKEYAYKVNMLCDGKGSIPAHLSPYREWYGDAFIRSNVDFLDRWDSDFNLFELYCIIAANYGVQDVASLLK